MEIFTMVYLIFHSKIYLRLLSFFFEERTLSLAIAAFPFYQRNLHIRGINFSVKQAILGDSWYDGFAGWFLVPVLCLVVGVFFFSFYIFPYRKKIPAFTIYLLL